MSIRALLFALVLVSAGPAKADPDWNDKAIRWHSYDEGIKAAQATGKPICMVFFTTWCPHCERFSATFKDPKIVASTTNFIMIGVDRDQSKATNDKYAPDGGYVPRVVFASSAGQIDEQIHSQRQKYKYNYVDLPITSATGPGPLLSSMDRAAKTLR